MRLVGRNCLSGFADGSNRRSVHGRIVGILGQDQVASRVLRATSRFELVREFSMRKRPTKQDAGLIKQLRRLSDEAEMRKARQWWRDEFWPASAEDYLKIERAPGTRKNQWLRLVTTYWGMAASLVLDSTLSERALLESKLSQEMFTVYSKVRPLLQKIRRQTHDPYFMANIETLILKSKHGRRQVSREGQGRLAIEGRRAGKR
jgi:hypothetical protein